MIRMIRGTLAHTDTTTVVVDVGGIGYGIHTISTDRPGTIGQSVSFYTHLAVRETALDVYGFTDQRTRDTFELLLSIPKIGPKSALQILESASVALLEEAVQLQDAGHLSKLSGIGKKTAEKIVLGLKDSFDTISGGHVHTTTPESAAMQDAFDALVALGYAPTDVRSALGKAPEAVDAQALIRYGLQTLS